MKTKFVFFTILLISFTAFSQKKWTLKACVTHALKNNITIKQNKLNIGVAEKDAAIAKGNFLPNVSGSSNGNYNEGLSDDGGGGLTNTKNFSSSFNLSSNGVIFNGYRNLNTYQQAKLGIERSKLDIEVIKNDISLRVVNTYLNVLFAKENLSVAQVQAAISKKQIERAQAQFDEGAIPKGDLLNVQSTAANDAQNVVTQENSLNIALLNLSQLLQVDYDGLDVAAIDVGSPSAALLLNSSKEVYDKALTNRPEIERAQLNVENSEISIDLAKGAYYPTLSYNIGASTSFFNQFNNLERNIGGTVFRISNDNFFQQLNDRFQYGAGLSLNIPIFNRFQTKNRVAQSKINKEVTELQLENQKLQLRQTIEQAFVDAKAAAKTFEAAQISLQAQNEAFKNAQESYNFGAMTLFDFDQIRNRLVSAKSALIRAKYNYVFTTKVLKFYEGKPVFD